MPLDFSKNGYENLFKNALCCGINIFCGAGFSLEASDHSGKKLPTGASLLSELKELFPVVNSYSSLPRACTKLIQTGKESFYSFLKKRFAVDSFNPLYLSLLNVKISNIYTTNIDDLFFKIFENTDKQFYLNDRSINGEEYNDSFAIHYFPLHGCIRSGNNYVFGATEIASAFSERGNKNSWNSLAENACKSSILFWGWNFEDSGPLEAMYGNGNRIDENANRWVLLHNPSDEMIDYLQSLKFNVIIGDTIQMLEYISDFMNAKQQDLSLIETDVETQGALNLYEIPKNDSSLPSYSLRDFFLDYAPRWSHIYSRNIPKTKHYKKIADCIASKKDVIIFGIRGSGKTTLMMQLLADYETPLLKHTMVSPSLEKVKTYIRAINGQECLLFVDDCFRDTNAVLALLAAPNIHTICSDRDFNYERQFHKLKNYSFVPIDITEIAKEDAQSIVNIIPIELKRTNIGTKWFEKDPSILNLLASNLKAVNFNFMKDFYQKDDVAARVFLMIVYVHACGVPCSFDMIYSFLGDEYYTWEQMYGVLDRVGGLIKDASNWFGQFQIIDTVQDYYQCRSRFFAEKIISSIPRGNAVFSSVLMDFTEYVPPYKICWYDKFKRSAYDADFSIRAFEAIEDGESFYKLCLLRDDSEYIYQQAAIYFSRKKNYKKAFDWIDKARNLAHYNRFSIDSTYAKICFDVNLENNQDQAIVALDILSNCCTNDKRKSIHFSLFGNCCLRYYTKYHDGSSREYINTALVYIDEGLEDSNLSLSNKNKFELKELKRKLVHCLEENT